MCTSRKIFFSIVVPMCFCFFIIFAEKAIGAVEDPPMAKLFLELYKSQDKNISYGAMLLSVEMYHTPNLEKFLRASINDSDTPMEKCIKLYTLSKFTHEYSDMKAFIESFPDTEEDFWALIHFECTVTPCPHSKMLKYLISFINMDYAVINEKDIALKNLAKKKMEKIHSLSDGWVSESIEYFLNTK